MKLVFTSENGDSIKNTMTFATPEVMESTLKKLAICGLKGVADDIATLGILAFDGRQVEIVVETKPDKLDLTKQWTNVKYINGIGANKQKKADDSKLDSKQALSMLAALGVNQALKAVKAANPELKGADGLF